MKKATTLLLCGLLAACATSNQPPMKTQLEIREFQTRSFATSKTNEVLSAIVEAFQDQGFMVKNVVPEVGLVSAVKESEVGKPMEFSLQFFGLQHDILTPNSAIVEATANVKTQSGKTKVRATFQEKVMNNRGGVDTVQTIEDPKFYQNFFDKVGKSIFIEKQKI